MTNFDNIKHINSNGDEYWLARELQEILNYKEWRNFNKVINTAIIACKISQQSIDYHFVEINKTIIMPKNAKKIVPDYQLTRYACYLIVMNGDPRKEVIAIGQTYFATKTRQQELNDLYERLTEDEKRLFIRSDIKQKNMLLAEVAQKAGITTNLDFAEFNNKGYMGLYGGLNANDIAQNKNLNYNENILDYMGSAELGANLFRITQTEEVLKTNNIDNKNDANQKHYEVACEVREAIKRIGGTMPENLPTPTKSITEISKDLKNKLN